MRSFANVTAISIVLAVTLVASSRSQAQTFSVIHTFTGGGDGATPAAGLSIDRGGNLYGTTAAGGDSGWGTVFKLKRSGTNWIVNRLYSFAFGNDGAMPQARVVFGPDGTLYGTTVWGGGGQCSNGCGTVFNLKPPPTVCKTTVCPWTETIIYHFGGGQTDGFAPYSEVVFDQVGDLYGTTLSGGNRLEGVVYQLTHSSGNWVENLPYTFQGDPDGSQPVASVTFDSIGNLYGTTTYGGSLNLGMVFELKRSGSEWTESIFHSFQGGNDGANPYAGITFDASGNLYGATSAYGSLDGGTFFGATGTLYNFAGFSGPYSSLTADAAGNLYGTTLEDGAYDMGSVFELSPHSDGTWTYTSLHDFTGGSDGGWPYGGVIRDAAGNLYGTAALGGSENCYRGCGVVWEITP
jgi:uncharacterized repeat protein (TIGR03803 family)